MNKCPKCGENFTHKNICPVDPNGPVTDEFTIGQIIQSAAVASVKPIAGKLEDDGISGTDVLIWSMEHAAWWRANSKGYTTSKQFAGRYSIEEAINICYGANRHSGEIPMEAIVPLNPTTENVK